MRVKKTRSDQRGVYRYPVDVPDERGGYRKTYTTINPGDDGTTEIMIQMLHRMGDDEVTNNVNNGHPKLTPEQKAAKSAWEEAHLGEKYPIDWKFKGNWKSVPTLSALKTPLRDGDTERPNDEAHTDSYFINANSETAPGIVDADRNQIIFRSEVYYGVYGRTSINFYAFTATETRALPAALTISGRSGTRSHLAARAERKMISLPRKMTIFFYKGCMLKYGIRINAMNLCSKIVMMLKRVDDRTGKCERSQTNEEEMEMGKKANQELKKMKSKKKAVMFRKVHAFLVDKFRLGYAGKAKELLQKYSVDILLSMVISVCDAQEQKVKIMAELFTYETVKLIVFYTAYRLVWGSIFLVLGYIIVNICQLVWHGITKFIRKIRSRSKEVLSLKDKQK